MRGSPEVALKAGEVYHLPLAAGVALPPPPAGPPQRMAAARKALRHAAFAQAAGVAGAGPAGLRRQLPASRRPASSARCSRPRTPTPSTSRSAQTGLALRDNVPRVYVIAAAGGGGSGFLADLGYAVRRLLKQMHQPEAPRHRLAVLRRPGRPGHAAHRAGQPLRHAHRVEPLRRPGDPVLRPVRHRRARARRRGLRLRQRLPADADQPLAGEPPRRPGPPGQLPVPRTDHAAGPAARQLPAAAAAGRRRRFRSLGTYGVWFPRGLLLRLAAQRVCQRLLEEWQAPGKEDLLSGRRRRCWRRRRPACWPTRNCSRRRCARAHRRGGRLPLARASRRKS